MSGTRAPLSERLWRRVDKGAPDECWPWTGFRTATGHGQIGTGGRRGITATHRVAWSLVNGPIPAGVVIRHSCDNPPCCNPAHLLSGTPGDNVRDMVERGRQMRGFDLPHTRLSEADVQFIRDHYRRGKNWSNSHELAARFGVRREHINAIVRGARRAAS